MLHMRWVPLYVLAALVTGLHNFYGLMEIVNGAPINPELHFPVRVSDVGGGRCSFAVSATRRRQAWVLGFNVVLGLLCAVDCCQPHYAFLDVARDSVRPFVPRLC